MPVNPAFDDDYPDLRENDQRERERTQVKRQIQSLLRMAKDSYYQRQTFAKLDGRRRCTPQRVQLQEIRRSPRSDLMVAENSVVALGPSGCSRLDIGRGGSRSVQEVLQRLNADNINAYVNYAIPLAGHIKGAGGPEPSLGARPFPAVQLAEPPPAALVALLDTGVSEEVRKDGYLGMDVAPGDRDKLDEFPPDGLLDAGAGHGSFVAGIIQQVAPTAEIVVHKVMDSDGITTDIALAAGLRRAAASGAKIINMSLGTETADDQPPPALLEAVQELRRRGVLLVCAAGNSADTEPVWPAALTKLGPQFDHVVAVAALDPDGKPARWSTHGSWVTCSTIGEGVVSTYVEGTEDGLLIDDPDPDTYESDSWACWTGTSFAAPQITGALVRLMSENAQLDTPAKALQALKQRATPDTKNGYGWSVAILPGT